MSGAAVASHYVAWVVAGACFEVYKRHSQHSTGNGQHLSYARTVVDVAWTLYRILCNGYRTDATLCSHRHEYVTTGW